MKLPRILPLIAIVIGGLVVVRGVGLVPGVFEGAKAWAEEAGPETAAARTPPPAVCALTPEQLAQQAGVSPAELRILQSLQTRRTELDARDADFAAMLPLMATAEQKLDAKLQAMTDLRTELQALLGQVDEREQAETDRLVAVYSAMRPRDAARVFATLDDSVRLPVAAAMRPRSLAAVMAQMDPAQARELTEKLARRFQAEELRARVAAANTAAPAAQAADAAARPAAAQASAAAPSASTSAAPQAAAAADATAATPTPARATPTPTPRRTSAPRRNTAARQPAAGNANQTAAQPATTEATGPRPYQAGASAAAGANRGAAPAAAAPTQARPRQSVN